MKENYLKLAESYEKLIESYQSVIKSLKAQAESYRELAAAPIEKGTKTTSEKKVIDIVTVRGVLAAKTQEGKSEAVKSLLEKFGAVKLSKVAPEKFEALLKEAEEL